MQREPDQSNLACKIFGGLLYGLLLSLFIVGPGWLEQVAHPGLLTEVPMSWYAGRDGDLIVPVQVFDGEKYYFIVDTGSTATFIDKSLTLRLGKSLGKVNCWTWDGVQTNEMYAAPKLFLGGVALKMDKRVIYTDDLGEKVSGQFTNVMGQLGMDVLQHYCLQLNFAAGKLYLLDATRADKLGWGRAIPLVRLSPKDPRPAVADNFLGLPGLPSLIDTGSSCDGWLPPKQFQQWTNSSISPSNKGVQTPNYQFAGEKYPFADLLPHNDSFGGLGLRFLGRHLVTFDFPNHMLYLRRESFGPLAKWRPKYTWLPALERLEEAVILNDRAAVNAELERLEQGRATKEERHIARNLAATLDDPPKPTPAQIPAVMVQVPLGDCQAEQAEVGWLEPAANRMPASEYIPSPVIDSGKVYASGLYAATPSRYVFRLDGKWDHLRGEAGLHTSTAFLSNNVVFCIKADGQVRFKSETIQGLQHALYDLDVHGVQSLELEVKNTQPDMWGSLALWLEPTLVRSPPPARNEP